MIPSDIWRQQSSDELFTHRHCMDIGKSNVSQKAFTISIIGKKLVFNNPFWTRPICQSSYDSGLAIFLHSLCSSIRLAQYSTLIPFTRMSTRIMLPIFTTASFDVVLKKNCKSLQCLYQKETRIHLLPAVRVSKRFHLHKWSRMGHTTPVRSNLWQCFNPPTFATFSKVSRWR